MKLPDLLTKRSSALHGEMIDEICKALERLGADAAVLSVVGSIGDTMPDEDVLRDLKARCAVSLVESASLGRSRQVGRVELFHFSRGAPMWTKALSPRR